MFSWGIDLSEIGQPSKKMKKKKRREVAARFEIKSREIWH